MFADEASYIEAQFLVEPHVMKIANGNLFNLE